MSSLFKRDELDRFITAFNIYINVDLRNSWKFKETYSIGIDGESVWLSSDETISQLGEILKIDKYKNEFERAVAPGISKLSPKSKENAIHGIYIQFMGYYKRNIFIPKIIITSKKLLYLDLIPRELLVMIFSELPHKIQDYVLVSTSDNSTIYNDLILNYLMSNKIPLWKWIKPVNFNYTYDDYSSFIVAMKKANFPIDYQDSNYWIKFEDINKFNALKNKKHNRGTILNFVVDNLTNFDSENGYNFYNPLGYKTKSQTLRAFYVDDDGWFSMIKMRQFYPQLSQKGIKHEKDFARQFYTLKWITDYYDDVNIVDSYLVDYVRMGRLSDYAKLSYLENPHKISDNKEYILNNLLYDPNVTFYNFDEYVNVLKYIYSKNKKLIAEYKDFIPKEKLSKLVERTKIDSELIPIVYELSTNEKDKIIGRYTI